MHVVTKRMLIIKLKKLYLPNCLKFSIGKGKEIKGQIDGLRLKHFCLILEGQPHTPSSQSGCIHKPIVFAYRRYTEEIFTMFLEGDRDYYNVTHAFSKLTASPDAYNAYIYTLIFKSNASITLHYHFPPVCLNP